MHHASKRDDVDVQSEVDLFEDILERVGKREWVQTGDARQNAKKTEERLVADDPSFDELCPLAPILKIKLGKWQYGVQQILQSRNTGRRREEME